MATDPSPQPTADDMHWGISYLREDIQDLRQDIRSLHSRIDSKFAQLLAAMVALTGITIGAVFALLQAYLPST